MLSVTGQRPKSKDTTVVQPLAPIVSLDVLQDHTHPINQRAFSGKQAGSMAVVWDSGAGTYTPYMSTGDSIDSEWEPLSNAQGGGGGGSSRSIVEMIPRPLGRCRVIRADGTLEDIDFRYTMPIVDLFDMGASLSGKPFVCDYTPV